MQSATSITGCKVYTDGGIEDDSDVPDTYTHGIWAAFFRIPKELVRPLGADICTAAEDVEFEVDIATYSERDSSTLLVNASLNDALLSDHRLWEICTEVARRYALQGCRLCSAEAFLAKHSAIAVVMLERECEVSISI